MPTTFWSHDFSWHSRCTSTFRIIMAACWTTYLKAPTTEDAITSVTSPGGLASLTGVDKFIIYVIELWVFLIFSIFIICVSIVISKAILIPSSLSLMIDFTNPPYLVEYHLISVELFTILPFFISVKFILVIFSERSSSKLNYFFPLNLHLLQCIVIYRPPGYLLCLSLLVFPSTPLSLLMLTNQ